MKIMYRSRTGGATERFLAFDIPADDYDPPEPH
jgi:hypothetical protein